MITEKGKKDLLGQLLLLTATLCWGTSFIILKNTIDVLPVLFVIAARFVISAAVLFVIFFKRIIHADKKSVLTGLLLGVILFVAYLLQTYGLKTLS
ncbi:MAG: EamA family transporter [Clostridia bacterium]|nr:EamA family transporter [Clostridia bacterium]